VSRKSRVQKLQAEVERLKERLNAVILAHNYQIPEVQEIADFVGDSLDLSRKAVKTDADVIVFCGVNFMAEMAKILNPDKTVLIPSLKARCPMADQLPARLVREAKLRHPDWTFITYVNTLAEAKAEADVCCTSANAPKIVEQAPSDTVLFGPDRNLAWYAERVSGKRVVPVPPYGHCYVHKKFRPEHIQRLREAHPDAYVLVHPECDPEVQELADRIGSTNQMVRYAGEVDAEVFVVGTEVGLVERLRRMYPEKRFIPANPDAVCLEMKSITLEAVRDALRDMKFEVEVPEDIASRARMAIEKMLSM